MLMRNNGNAIKIVNGNLNIIPITIGHDSQRPAQLIIEKIEN